MLYSTCSWLIRASILLVLAVLECTSLAQDAGSINLRVMAANLNGNAQTIEPYSVRIFKGLKPDVVAIQEFNYLNDSASDIRAFVDEAFGTNFSYFRESNFQIPNGIISRYPIIASGSWTDVEVSNRGFAWARIDLPGTNDLYVVSVHLLTSSSTDRSAEASNLKALIQASFPANAWIVVGGDMNTDNRSEAAISTFKTFLSDSPVPTDGPGTDNPNTNNGRNKPYDYVLPSYNFAALLTNTVFASRSFPKGLVFDSRVYTPLTDVPGVLAADSGNGQHMGVIKDFHINFATNYVPPSGLPYFVATPQSRTVPAGTSVTFASLAAGDAPLSYQWRSNSINIAGATGTNYIIGSAQAIHQAEYSVVVTNLKGAITSAPAVLKIAEPGFDGILVGWDMSGVSSFGLSPMAPTTNSALLVIDGLRRGPGLTTNPTAAGRSWGANGFGAATAATAIGEGDYATFSVGALPGYTVSFQAISKFDYKRSSTGPVSGLLQAQVGAGTFFDIATVSYAASGSISAVDLSALPALQNVGGGTNVTFRIVNYSGASGGNWYITDAGSSAEPDFVITGSVKAVPAPPTVAPSFSNAQILPSGGIRFTVQGASGSEVIVEAASAVTGPWLPVVTNQAGQSWTNSMSLPAQFFRGRLK